MQGLKVQIGSCRRGIAEWNGWGGRSSGFHGHLPHMGEDPLAFFHALEKILQLNTIVQSDWHKLLPPLLNDKAAKCNSHITIDEWGNYEFVKKDHFNEL